MTEISRRALLGAAGVAGIVAGAVAVGVQAGLGSRRPMALLDSDFDTDSLAAARALVPGMRTRMLEPDLVWQWRRDLGDQVAKAGAAVAIVRWDKAFVLAGLAREAGLPVRQEQVARSMFRIHIG